LTKNGNFWLLETYHAVSIHLSQMVSKFIKIWDTCDFSIFMVGRHVGFCSKLPLGTHEVWSCVNPGSSVELCRHMQTAEVHKFSGMLVSTFRLHGQGRT